MTCWTKIGPDKTVICGHSLMQHDADESGMGEGNPCMVCGCQEYTGTPSECPTCGSTAPERHPAVQHEGEVNICPDPWHSSTHAGREALNKAIGHAYYEQWKDAEARKVVPLDYGEEFRAGVYVPPQQLTPGGPVHGGWTYVDTTERCPSCKSTNPNVAGERCSGDGGTHVWHQDHMPISNEPGTKGIYLPSENKAVQKWADEAMFTAEPINADEGPRVTLLTMTPDPLGAIAAATLGYKGRFVRSLAEISDEERIEMFEQVQKTHLKAPFEFVQFHFLIEGVTRGFTHQMVRQRTATYVQESTRFAVKEDMPVGLPPSLAGTEYRPAAEREKGLVERDATSQKQRDIWENSIDQIETAYMNLVESNMPAEDARGLLPTNLLTKIQYRTDLRSLLEHGGNRLCTQAQFEWRLVFTKIVEAIRNYPAEHYSDCIVPASDAWQYAKLADMFRPICYLTGKCEFKADFDRKCSIRSRVDANADLARPSAQWHEDHDEVPGEEIIIGVNPDLRTIRNENNRPVFIGAIRPAEWLLNPGAAR